MEDSKHPTHPGPFIRANIVEALGLTVGQAAAALGVTRQTLSGLLNGHTSLTPEMGMRVEKAFGIELDTLVQMQTEFDIAAAREKSANIDVTRYQLPEAAPDLLASIKLSKKQN